MSDRQRRDVGLSPALPSTATLAMRVDAMHQAGLIVTVTSLAQHFGIGEPAVKRILQRAELLRMLRYDQERGWIPDRT